MFVTFLWSTSFVLIKIGLRDIPAVTFAGLRYSLAFLCLLPLALGPAHRAFLRALTARQWGRLLFLGLLFYTVTQGALFLGLLYLPAATVTLFLSFSPVIVAALGIILLAESLSFLQWCGVGLFLAGVWIYLYPVILPTKQLVGLAIVTIGVLANSASSIFGRHVNRRKDIDPLSVTIVSMGVGAVVLLATGISFQGLPRLSPVNWITIIWLAVVNTALAFTLWNHSLRTLSAVESSIINNTMLAQISILAWLFLGERLGATQITGLVFVTLGSLIVQVRKLETLRRSAVPNDTPMSERVEDEQRRAPPTMMPMLRPTSFSTAAWTLRMW